MEAKSESFEKLPFHQKRKALKEAGIKFRPSDKEKDLLKMWKDQETIHKKEEPKRMPKLEKQEKETLALLPEDIMPQIKELEKKGMTYQINKEDCTVTFKRDLTATANLDQSANNILRTAKYTFAGRPPQEKFRDGRPVEWA